MQGLHRYEVWWGCTCRVLELALDLTSVWQNTAVCLQPPPMQPRPNASFVTQFFLRKKRLWKSLLRAEVIGWKPDRALADGGGGCCKGCIVVQFGNFFTAHADATLPLLPPCPLPSYPSNPPYPPPPSVHQHQWWDAPICLTPCPLAFIIITVDSW